MEQTPDEYANELIEKFLQLKKIETFGWSGMDVKMAIQCAIIDIENTIEALSDIEFTDCWDSNKKELIKYYTEALTILKSKL